MPGPRPPSGARLPVPEDGGSLGGGADDDRLGVRLRGGLDVVDVVLQVANRGPEADPEGTREVRCKQRNIIVGKIIIIFGNISILKKILVAFKFCCLISFGALFLQLHPQQKIFLSPHTCECGVLKSVNRACPV